MNFKNTMFSSLILISLCHFLVSDKRVGGVSKIVTKNDKRVGGSEKGHF